MEKMIEKLCLKLSKLTPCPFEDSYKKRAIYDYFKNKYFSEEYKYKTYFPTELKRDFCGAVLESRYAGFEVGFKLATQIILGGTKQ